MNYDQHYPGGDPGAVSSQDWFVKNLQEALKVIPKDKLICAVANYGYDWAMKKGQKKGTPPEDIHSVTGAGGLARSFRRRDRHQLRR